MEDLSFEKKDTMKGNATSKKVKICKNFLKLFKFSKVHRVLFFLFCINLNMLKGIPKA